MQDIYIQTWCRPQQFDPERGTLSAWLLGIAPMPNVRLAGGIIPECVLGRAAEFAI
jgi:hypothetical protein